MALETPASEALYRRLLFTHLTDRDSGEVGFFVNDRRFNLLRDMAGAGLSGKILNVASGPFALEFYVAPDACSIDSIDIDPLLPALHADLVAHGLIANTRFHLSDVMDFHTDERYDAIIINDLFYTKYVDFHAVLERYSAFLKPGGLLYFDILDRRAGPIWSAFNKDSRYRRYDMAAVRDTLAERGFEVMDCRPSAGIKGGLDEIVRRGLWLTAGIANNLVFLARRTGMAIGFAAMLFSFEGFDPKTEDRQRHGHRPLAAVSA